MIWTKFLIYIFVSILYWILCIWFTHFMALLRYSQTYFSTLNLVFIPLVCSSRNIWLLMGKFQKCKNKLSLKTCSPSLNVFFYKKESFFIHSVSNMRQMSFDQLQQKHASFTITNNSDTKKENNSWPHQDSHTFYPGKMPGVCSCDGYIY